MLLVPIALLLATAPAAQLTPAQRDGLRGELIDLYDASNGGFGSGEKSIDSADVEAVIALSRAGDRRFDEMGPKTLDGGLRLLDPGGGIYRSSADAEWRSAHKEKPIAAEAEALSAFSLGYAVTKSPRYLAAARSIAAWLLRAIAQDGAFGGAARSGKPAPAAARIDPDENGLAIQALAQLSSATGDKPALEAALKAARAMLAHHALPGGGFARGADAAHATPSVDMARALLALYLATGDRGWLAEAVKAARQLEGSFPQWKTGDVEELAKLARFANLLAHVTGGAADRKLADEAFAAALRGARGPTPRALSELLLADLELSSEPLHMNVVGPKESPAARALFEAALTTPSRYARIEWWDPREGPLPNPDIPLPKDGPPAAYSCTHGICSLPLKTPAKVAAAALR